MNLLSALQFVAVGLVSDARDTLIGCMLDTWNRTRSTPQEPDFVAELVLQGTPELETKWRRRLIPLGLSISVGGVFCHQSPQVKYSGMLQRSSCEIGDLLWVHSHSSGGKVVRRNALLYQAKRSASQPLKMNANDDQLRLYMEWPDFTYTRSPGLNGQSRSVRPRTSHAGAQFMVIDPRPPSDPASGLTGWPGTYPIGSCEARPVMTDRPLEEELFWFLAGASGREYCPASTAAQCAQGCWSQVVWDLLQCTASRTFTRSKAGYAGTPRGAGTISLASLDGAATGAAALRATGVMDSLGDHGLRVLEAIAGEGDGGNIDWSEYSGNEGGGVSVVAIHTSEEGE